MGSGASSFCGKKALELAEHNVTVNAYAPGVIETPMINQGGVNGAEQLKVILDLPVTISDRDNMLTDWDAANVKVQLRVAAQRLGYARDRKDAQAQVTGRDITTLLQQGNVGIARAKAQKLIHDDVMGHLSEMLEMQIGVLLERFSDLDSETGSEFPSPAVVEAAASIVYAAQRDEFKGHRFGSAFVHSSITNRDGYVSPQIVRALSMPPASVAEMNRYLADVAKTYGYRWRPELLPDDILNIISEILDGSNGTPVDMPRLRKVCAHAGFDHAHGDPLSPLDASLEDAVKDLFRIPPKLFAGLEEEPEAAPLCPFDDSAPDEIKIEFACVLDSRLLGIRSRGAEHPLPDIPEIRLEDDVGSSMPEFQEKNGKVPKLQTLHTGGAHPLHASALTRILYIHSRLNPAHKSPHLASILIPLYSVLNQEIEPLDLAHVEADTFWVFEAVVSEFAELEDDQGSTKWMRALSQRLQWADPDLFEDMSAKGLDPALPHYSYRWLAPILTHTLPVQAVLMAWDAIFSYPMTTPDSCPKLDHLVDVCTSMLILARRPILCLGKPGRFPQGLWNEDNLNSPVSPAFGTQLDNAFVEGMALLQDYSVQAAGGIESIIQIASELAQRRIMQVQPAKPTTPSVGLGSRIRDTLGRGFTNTAPSPESSDEEESTAEEESSDDEKTPAAAPTQQGSTITSRLAGQSGEASRIKAQWTRRLRLCPLHQCPLYHPCLRCRICLPLRLR
ncbi:hypothetical protein EWM64_g617 [Hericium alpestre]|uniref:Rab-GAP TBC domain-containing protein n=1 Tax=Hericium alpestre TaxID=135208 RepID=A0A4Z0A9K5_9AGAM|nr:hypothetical protein EWM64_g617 [Hericium alpestre]